MASLGAYFWYMCAAAAWSSSENFHLFCLTILQPYITRQKIDVALAYQSGSAVVQLALLVLLCPRTLYVDGYFVVSLHGPAQTFNPSTGVVCFAILVGLATNNILPTTVSFIHRLLIVMNRKVSYWATGMLLALLMLPYVKVMKYLIDTEEWSTRSWSTLSHESIYNRTTEDTNFIGHSTTTPEAKYVIVVAVLSPLLVLFFAMLVNLTAHHLLLRVHSTEVARGMLRTLVQALIDQAAIPSITAVNALIWMYRQKIVHLFPYVDYVGFGVGPFILYFQASKSLRSISLPQREYRWVYRVAIEACHLILLYLFVGFCLLTMVEGSTSYEAAYLRAKSHGRGAYSSFKYFKNHFHRFP